MNAIYADSSFISSLYAPDIHSVAARSRMASQPLVYLSPLNQAEVAHALYHQAFRGRISTSTARFAWHTFEEDRAAGLWYSIDLPERVWQRCSQLAQTHGPLLGVRTLDSLHVACALELGAERFWTFDERQAKLAEAMGLDTRG